MALESRDYLRHLHALMPVGPAWPRYDGALFTRFLHGLSDELARVDSRVDILLDEIDPRSAAELFAEWECVAGLPDMCATAFGGEQTLSQRRDALVGRIVSQGGQSPKFLISLAANLGYTVTITEFKEHDVNDCVDCSTNACAWNFAFAINSSLDSTNQISVDSFIDEPIAWWGNALLECVISRAKPAHTAALFVYS